MFTILIRTYRRPQSFFRCVNSVIFQTYNNYELLIGCQEPCSYYPALLLEPQRIGDVPDSLGIPAPHNLLLNQLHQHVKGGWVMYLDDDDELAHDRSLEVIARKIKEVGRTDVVITWRVNINGKIIPKGVPDHKPGNISSIGFCFHSSQLPLDWEGYTYGDYRVFQKLLKRKLEVVFIDKILTKTQGKPGRGKRTEI